MCACWCSIAGRVAVADIMGVQESSGTSTAHCALPEWLHCAPQVVRDNLNISAASPKPALRRAGSPAGSNERCHTAEPPICVMDS